VAIQIPSDLKVGDILLYSSLDIFDIAIELKESDGKAHIEIFAGNAESWASRNGIGVNLYPFRSSGLVGVRRPKGIFNKVAVDAWFANGVRGMKYGWSDILASLAIKGAGSPTTDIKQFSGVDCSHFAAALMEVAECPQFDTGYSKNKITPAESDLSLGSVRIHPP
jgi:hypothetical protein